MKRTNPSTAVLEVQKAIKSLSEVPGEFYEVLVPLVNELKKLIQSPSILKAVVQEVFETSVNTSQFRYSGARMCSYLSQHLALKAGSGNFLTELVNRCLKEYESVSTAGGFQTLAHLIGFTLFMGELLVCMREAEEIRRAFPARLEDLLMTLTSNQSPHAFRCVIQSLKLTGAILDELVPQAAELYIEIERFIDDSNIPESIQLQIKALLDLRSRGWERNAEDCDESKRSDGNLCDESVQEAWPDPVDSIYFDQNEGYLIDEAEALENLKLTDDDDGNENVEYLVNGQPMDAETALAFENFIQQLPTSQSERPPEELSAASGYYQMDPRWQMDGWSTVPPSFPNNSVNFAVAEMPDYYGQNYDMYPYFTPLENHPNSSLVPLQSNVQPGIPITVPPPKLVPQPLSYIPSIQVTGSEREAYETSVATADLQLNPSSVNGPMNGVLPPYSNPPFGR